MSGLPPWVHAASAIAMGLGAVFLWTLLWKAIASPGVRHATGTCNPWSCQKCKDEARNFRVSEYAREAKEGKAAREGHRVAARG